MKYNKYNFINVCVLFLISIVTISTISLKAQESWEISWQQCYGTEEAEEAIALLSTPQGYMILGNINYAGFERQNDAVVYHIDKKGNLLWRHTYGGTEHEYAMGIIADNQGYYYLGIWTYSNDGDVQSGNHGSGDRWIVKIDLEGNIIWEQCYGGAGDEYGGQLKLLSNGNILTYGATTSGDGDVSVNYGYLDNWLMIINPEGEILQSRVFGNIGQNNIFDIVETRDGGFFFASKASEVEGMVEGDYHGGLYDVWAVKLDADMEIEWQQLYGGSRSDYGYFGAIELNNGYIFLALTNSPNDGNVSGYHYGTSHNGYATDDIWAVRIDSVGNILWQRCLGGSSWDYPTGRIYPMQDGTLMILAETSSQNGDVLGNHETNASYGSRDTWMIRLSADGELLWNRCFGGSGSEKPAFNVLQLADDNWLIAAAASKYRLADSLERGDVTCVSEDDGTNIWLYNFKDCANYMPATPQPPTGPDTLCHTTDSTSVYQIAGDSTAWGYNWLLEPAEAGIITADSLQAMVKWNSSYQGPATIKAASWNDCGESAWSQAKTSMVYSCVGLQAHNNESEVLKVYPNPATDYVIFEIPSKTGTIEALLEMHDIFGRNHATKRITSAKTVLDLRQFKQGIYFYKMEFEGHHYSGKIIVQR